MKFYVGLHQPSDAHQFERCMVSVNRLWDVTGRRTRKSDFAVNEWIMDSGAFSKVNKYGGYPNEPEEYAEQVNRWSRCGQMVAAVSEDYMCEAFVLERTGKTLPEHQALTVERYERIRRAARPYVMPVLQGFEPHEYVRHLRHYGKLITDGMWVGVGSVCKRNGNPTAIESVLLAILRERPDLRLHGFGIKLTALGSYVVRRVLYSADSMAWSGHERKQGRSANDPAGAHRYVRRVAAQRPAQTNLLPELLEVA